MQTVLTCSGFGLDRAWPEFDSTTGESLRAWSLQLLDDVVAAAYEHRVDAVVVVGDLLERTTALPSTVAEVADLWASLDVPVVVVPGERDWYGPNMAYDYGDWAGVEVAITEGAHATSVDGWWAAPATRPHRGGEPVRGIQPEQGPRTFVAAPGASAVLGSATEAFLVTTGPTFTVDENRLVLPPLCDPYGETAAALVRLDGTVETVKLSPSPLAVVEVDVTDCPDTTTLGAALDQACDGLPLARLILTGTVAAEVLLPGYSGWAPRPGVTLDLDALSFGAASLPEASGQSADAQFLQAMQQIDATDLERHQAIALGLLALGEDA